MARGELRDAERSVEMGTGGGHTDPADFEVRSDSGDVDALKLAGGGHTDPVDEDGTAGAPGGPLGGGPGTSLAGLAEDAALGGLPDAVAGLADGLSDVGDLADRINPDVVDELGE